MSKVAPAQNAKELRPETCLPMSSKLQESIEDVWFSSADHQSSFDIVIKRLC